INIDRDRAARYGLNVGDIQDVIETGLGGKAATELWEGEKHFSVVVRLPESERRAIPSIISSQAAYFRTAKQFYLWTRKFYSWMTTSPSGNQSRSFWPGKDTRWSARLMAC